MDHNPNLDHDHHIQNLYSKQKKAGLQSVCTIVFVVFFFIIWKQNLNSERSEAKSQSRFRIYIQSKMNCGSIWMYNIDHNLSPELYFNSKWNLFFII